MEQYWSWIENKFIPYLFPASWYNGDPYMARFVADTEPSKIISMARMRQLRVKKSKFLFGFVIRDLTVLGLCFRLNKLSSAPLLFQSYFDWSTPILIV